MATPPTLLWVRRDLRLRDNAALDAALRDGGPVIPVFIHDDVILRHAGAAPAWRLGRSLASFAASLEEIGGRLILRQGDALACLRALAEETGARRVRWSRLYDLDSIERDKAVKAALREDGLEAESHGGWLLREPFELKTQADEPYKVYTPFWKAFIERDEPGSPLAPPSRWPASDDWPESLDLDALGLGKAMRRGAEVVARYARVGEAAAEERFEDFLEDGLAGYGRRRDRLDRDGTSMMSAHLATGEISPRRLWHGARKAIERDPAAEQGGTTFLKELVWREFAWSLAYHFPAMATENWRSEWDEFPWREDEESEAVQRWRQGRTGVDVVDAAMRQVYVTGTMHNRARMLVASYLTKHLLTHWRIGEAWFRDVLVDWDPASNAMGWQWAAGSGPDASPFFRIFNPETQAEKFDPDGAYRRHWLTDFERYVAQGSAKDGVKDSAKDGAKRPDALAFFEACPKRWGLSPEDERPAPLVDLKAGRERALAAYQDLKRDTRDNQ